MIPLLPIAAGIGGGLAGFGLGGLFDNSGTKKTDIIGVQHAPYETYTYAPTTSQAYNITMPETNIIYDSPLSRISTKKDLAAEASAEGGSQPVSGTNLTHLALIGAVGLVGYGLVSKRR